MTWTYCPECGSKSLHHQEGEHKQCAVCHQEWFSDIDYSETVRGNLEKSKGDLYRMQTELTEAREYNKELHATLLKVRDSEIHEGRLLYDSITKLLANQSSPVDQDESIAQTKCDGNHGGPRCTDPECWNDALPQLIDINAQPGYGHIPYSEGWNDACAEWLPHVTCMQTELDSVNAMVSMLESGEWAEHAGKGPIAERLETAITSLVNESAEKYALEDQVKGLQELMASGLPHDWRDRLMEEMSTRFELSKHSEDHLANDDTQIGVEFAIDWIESRLKP